MPRNDNRLKVLFVCSRNQWRSPTAEQVWRRHPALQVRSGGTSAGARHRVSADDVAWADVILVMEERHQSRLKADFGRLLAQKRLHVLVRDIEHMQALLRQHVLDIPDEYRYMDQIGRASCRERV